MNITIPRLSESFSFTTKQTLQKELHRTQHAYKSLLNNVTVGIVRTDIINESIIKINQTALNMLQYNSLEEIQSTTIEKLYQNSDDYKKHITQLRRKGRVTNLQLNLKRLDGKSLVVLINSIIHFEEGEARWIDSSIQDITTQDKIQKKMFKLAHYDALTGLSNRYAFMQKLEASLESAQRYERQIALLFIDLDGFKQINDTYGHKSGDAVLIEIAKRFKKQVRKSDIVSRMGGDEFTILIPEYEAVHDIAGLAQKIVLAASEPIELKNATVNVSASIGISLYPHDGKSPDLLLSSADNAMYYAKELGKNNYQFFSKELNTESVNRLIFEMELKYAIQRQELYIDFQPYIDLEQKKVTSLDAHIKWNNPDFGEVNPSEFIPVAEECRFIKELGMWSIKESLHHMSLWHKIKGFETLSLTMNLSCEHLNDEHFVADLEALLHEYHYPAKLLEFSVQELALSKNAAHPVLFQIRELGCHIIIDNFGSAATSFNIFHKLQPKAVKLSASLTHDIHTITSKQQIFFATQGMAKPYNFTIIGSDIEMIDDKQWLEQHGCKRLQGAFFSKPLPVKEVSNTLMNLHKDWY